MRSMSEGFKLLLDTSKPSQEPMMMLQWCLTPATVEQLRKREVKNPCLLLVIQNDQGDEQRELVPLSQMQKLIEFNRSGKHVIHARIIWNDKGNIGALHKEFLRLESGSFSYYHHCQYNKRVLWPDFDEEGEVVSYEIDENLLCGLGSAREEIEVAKGHFAKEPPTWERWWVNLWFETKPRDRCQFRKRRFLAYSLQPPIVLAWVTFITILRFLIATLLLFSGMREVDYLAVIHPFNQETKDLLYEIGENGSSTSFFLRSPDRNQTFRKWAFVWWWFTPLVQIGLFGLYTAIGVWLLDDLFELSFWSYLLAAVVTPLAILVLLAFFVLLNALFGNLGSPIKKQFRRAEKWLDQQMKESLALERGRAKRKEEERLVPDTFRQQYELLICDGRDTPRPTKEIPRSWSRTPVLLYEEVKFRFCKPFAR